MKIGCSRLKYASDKTIKEKLEIWFIKDHSKAIKFRIFTTLLKVASCILYILQVLMDPISVHYSSTSSSHKSNKNPNWINSLISPLSSASTSDGGHVNLTWVAALAQAQQDAQDDIDWNHIFFVKRHPIIRYSQLVIAVYGLIETLFYFYLCYNHNFLDKFKNVYFYIEIICTVPWIIEYLSPRSKDIFIPVFLNCWLIKRNLNYIFKDFNNINIKHHNSVIGQHLISLGTLFFCLIFTSVCGFQHLQRANLKESISLFDSLYYIITTFSTVGYGDITPNTWPSKLFMAVMIIVALVVIPTQLEHLASLWFERQNLGASYSSHRAANEKHIVVCSTNLQYDLIIDFLHEFYAHRKNHSIHTILLSSCELDIQLRSLLHTPLWKQRVFYIHGSALRDTDLGRAKVHQAKAVFIIASRGIDKDLADQHSILRSWAIKDFAPHTPQFVQLFRPENKINLKFAEYLVCEDEFKYALLANNCLCPGISTLVTLLLHKSKLNPEKETHEGSIDDWQNIYSKLAGNEIHSITAENSKFFQEYIGKTFIHASCMAHKKYNVCLIGIGKSRKRFSSMAFSSDDFNYSRSSSVNSNTSKSKCTSLNIHSKSILLNPGPHYEIEPQDICYYISLVKEENYNWKSSKSTKSFAMEELYQNMMIDGPDLSMRTKAAERAKARDECADRNFNVLEAHAGEFIAEKSSSNCESMSSHTVQSLSSNRKVYNDIKATDLIVGKPPNPLYIGCNPTLCKLLKVPNHICCLELNRECEHKTSAQASDYKWRNKCILVVAECATNGLFNFILPLRAQVRSIMFLRPIVLLLENTPSIEFLEAISSFPLVYWMKGSISNLSTILKAGIMDSETVIVVSPEKQANIDDDSLTDCSNIVSVQNLYRLFPRIKVVAELTKATNIRFMKFRAKEMIREEDDDDGDIVTSFNIMGYMMRQPFASGNVFSASMMDTLLYQTFGKPYLIELIRLLIGISQTPGSGNLTSIPLTESDMWIKTYGNLYKKLVQTTGEIPIGLYRTKAQDKKNRPYRISSKLDIQQMILIKMNKLGIDPDKYKSYDEHSERFSFVLINPSHDYLIKPGDIVYLLKPGTTVMSKTMSLDLAGENGSPASTAACTKGQNNTSSSAAATIGASGEYGGLKDTTITSISTSQPQSPNRAADYKPPEFPISLGAATSHLSIDESWLEDAINATNAIDNENCSEMRDSSLNSAKLNFSSLKRLFMPSLRSSSTAIPTTVVTSGTTLPQQIGEEEEEAAWLTEVANHGKVRSKSMAVPTTQYRRGKVAKQALRKMFYRNKQINRREDFINNNTNI